MNENIKHLRQIIENSIPAETTSGQPSPTRAEAQVVLDLLETDMREATEQVTNIKAMREDMANEIERLQVDSKPEVRGLLHTVVKWIMAGQSSGAFGGIGPSECREVANAITTLRKDLTERDERIETLEESLRNIDANRGAESEDAYTLYRRVVNSANIARRALTP